MRRWYLWRLLPRKCAKMPTMMSFLLVRMQQMQRSSVLEISICWPVTDGMASKCCRHACFAIACKVRDLGGSPTCSSLSFAERKRGMSALVCGSKHRAEADGRTGFLQAGRPCAEEALLRRADSAKPNPKGAQASAWSAPTWSRGKRCADQGGAWFDLFRTSDRKFGIIPSTLYKMAKGVEREGQTQALCPFAHRRD